MSQAKVLFVLSGSIAAWKACAVISRLVQDGHAVQAVATPSALRFVGAATLEGLTGRPVCSDLWEAGAAMEHINLTKWADLVVLCPATASTLNRLAAGLGDDLLGALFLAFDWRKPCLIAPAMNPAMWSHPATAASVERLRGWGATILPVARGRLACGDEGDGRLIEPEEILAAIRIRLFTTAGPTRPGRPPRVLVTAGGTEEPIDGVRTIGNFSTGRTGAALAEACALRGCEVTLLRAHRAAPARPPVAEATFGSFAELEAALRRELGGSRFDVVVHAAAVGDYSVASLEIDGLPRPAARDGKLDSGREVMIRLQANPKLVDHLRGWSANPDLRVVAFKLTRGADAAARQAAVAALFAHSGADAVVHNDLAEQGADPGAFPATIHRADGASHRIESRGALADEVARLVGELATPGTSDPA